MATTPVKKKKISTQPAKAKGRNLQKWVVAELLKRYPQLTDMDLRSCPMGSHGADIVMSQLAQNEIPANFECKSLAKVAVYGYYEQAKSHGKHEPIVIIKQNGCAPLAIIDATVLFDMMAGNDE